MSDEVPMATFRLPSQDFQLVMQILQQALLPYQRLGQVMQEMQRQALEPGQPGHIPNGVDTEQPLQAPS